MTRPQLQFCHIQNEAACFLPSLIHRIFPQPPRHIARIRNFKTCYSGPVFLNLMYFHYCGALILSSYLLQAFIGCFTHCHLFFLDFSNRAGADQSQSDKRFIAWAITDLMVDIFQIGSPCLQNGVASGRPHVVFLVLTRISWELFSCVCRSPTIRVLQERVRVLTASSKKVDNSEAIIK